MAKNNFQNVFQKWYNSQINSQINPPTISTVFSNKPAPVPRAPNPHPTFPTILAQWPTGSSYICNPPVTNTDVDKLVLVKELPFKEDMKALGWELDGTDKYTGEEFHSYRHENLNFILTENRWFYVRMVAATELAKQLNLTDKNARIDLFQAVVSGTDLTHLPNKLG